MDNRRTGRTTRMLEEAISVAKEGKYVIVVGANAEQAKSLQAQAATMAGEEMTATKIYIDGGPGQITFESCQMNRQPFDWQSLRLQGAFPTIPTFMDHFAFENTFAKAIHEAHRWDDPLPRSSEETP